MMEFGLSDQQGGLNLARLGRVMNEDQSAQRED